jgi:hypothetical protein
LRYAIEPSSGRAASVVVVVVVVVEPRRRRRVARRAAPWIGSQMMAFRRITQDDASSSNISIISSLLLLLFSSGSCWAHVNGGRETAVTIDLSSTVEQKLSKFWQASVGSGHAALGVPGAIPTTIPLAPHSSLGRMWQEQLKAVHDDTGIYGVRFHGSFDDDMGPVAVATTSGEIKYNFTQLDVLYDGIMAAGVTPIVELSFMPTAIADCDPGHCPTGMHYRGVEAHPRKWSMWYDLVHAFTTHMVQRHGLQEIIKWRFEVWINDRVCSAPMCAA